MIENQRTRLVAGSDVGDTLGVREARPPSTQRRINHQPQGPAELLVVERNGFRWAGQANALDGGEIEPLTEQIDVDQLPDFPLTESAKNVAA